GRRLDRRAGESRGNLYREAGDVAARTCEARGAVAIIAGPSILVGGAVGLRRRNNSHPDKPTKATATTKPSTPDTCNSSVTTGRGRGGGMTEELGVFIFIAFGLAGVIALWLLAVWVAGGFNLP